MNSPRPRQGAAAALASSSSVKRQSLEVGPEQLIRSRPSSPGPGSLRNSGDSDDEYAHVSGRANGDGLGLGLHVGPSGGRHPLSTSPIVNSAASSGASTPLDKRKPAYPDTYLASPTLSTRGNRSMRIDTSGGDEHSPLLSVGVERPSTPNIQQREYLSIPHDDFDGILAGGESSFISSERGGSYIRPPTLRSRIKLFWTQLVANLVSTGFLLLIVVWALLARSIGYVISRLAGNSRPRKHRAWDNPQRWAKEELVKDVKYYARSCGYDIEDQEVITQDGYKLRVHRVIVPSQRGKRHSDGRGGFPVIIQHGLFQTSGSFVTSEERSLAFWLAEHGGYQVYLSNGRAVFDMGHISLSRSDPRFWDYNIRELALYDLPAVVEHVKQETGYEKVAFIGHSQGNATMFCSLARGMVPALGESLSVFVALAPAVFAGPLTRGFPFTAIKNMPWKTWRRIFGVLDYIPVMRWSYDWVPGLPFALLGYQMFAFLFDWTDKNWLERRKPKMFRFTPSPVSSASVWWWTGAGGNFAKNGCILNEQVDRWFGPSFPPLSLYHGGRDYLVLAEPLLRRLAENEPDVRVIRVHKLEEGEHCDNFWEADAVENSFVHILEDIEKTRPRYPEELDDPGGRGTSAPPEVLI